MNSKKEPIKILIVSGDRYEPKLIEAIIEPIIRSRKVSFKIELAKDLTQANETIKKISFDLMIINITLKGPDSVNAVEMVKWARKKNPRVSFILVADQYDSEVCSIGLSLALGIFLGKTFKAKNLGHALVEALNWEYQDE